MRVQEEGGGMKEILQRFAAWLLLSLAGALLAGYAILVAWRYPGLLLFVGFLVFCVGCCWAFGKVADIMDGK
jgi:hypothetical protein